MPVIAGSACTTPAPRDRGAEQRRVRAGEVGVGLPSARHVAERLGAAQRGLGRAAADAELQPPAADQVGGRGLLGHVERVLVAHVDDAGADLDAARARADRGQQRERRGELPREVVHADVRAVEAELLGRHGELDRLHERVAGGARLRAGGRLPVAEGEEPDAGHAPDGTRDGARAAAQDRARDGTRWARGPMWRGEAVPIIARPEKPVPEGRPMATTEAAPLDAAKLEQFVFRAVDEVGATLNAALVVMGDQLGLYRALAGAGPLTPAELADAHRDGRALRARVAERPGRGRLRRLRPRRRPLHAAARADRRADRRGQPRVPARASSRSRSARCSTRRGSQQAARSRRRRRLARAQRTTSTTAASASSAPATTPTSSTSWLPALDGVVRSSSAARASPTSAAATARRRS